MVIVPVIAQSSVAFPLMSTGTVPSGEAKTVLVTFRLAVCGLPVESAVELACTGTFPESHFIAAVNVKFFVMSMGSAARSVNLTSRCQENV
jgi:hypothetical protein